MSNKNNKKSNKERTIIERKKESDYRITLLKKG